MNLRLLRRLCILALVAACSQAAPTEIIPFTVEETRQLFRLQWPNDPGFAGHAFLLDRPGQRPLAVTAFHVAGPVPVTQLPSPSVVIVHATLRHVVFPDVVVRLGERVPIPGARTLSQGDTQHDLAAFDVIDWDPARALQLSDRSPDVGDTLTVLAVHYGSGGPDQHPLSGPRRHKVVVITSTTVSFGYTYIGSANANFTSGAAVLDSDGRVVGVNIGTTTGGGRVDGIGVGLDAIRALLPP